MSRWQCLHQTPRRLLAWLAHPPAPCPFAPGCASPSSKPVQQSGQPPPAHCQHVKHWTKPDSTVVAYFSGLPCACQQILLTIASQNRKKRLLQMLSPFDNPACTSSKTQHGSHMLGNGKSLLHRRCRSTSTISKVAAVVTRMIANLSISPW